MIDDSHPIIISKPAALVSSELKGGLHQQGTKFMIGSLHAHVRNWISSRLCILTKVITPIDSEEKGLLIRQITLVKTAVRNK